LPLHALDVVAKLRRSDLTAQQRFIADDNGADRVGKLIGELNAGFDLITRAVRMARNPDAQQHLQAVALRDLRDLIEPDIDRIGADAISDLGERRQVLFDLPRFDPHRKIERRLRTAKWRIGHTIKLLAGIERRRRHRNCGAKPPPTGNDRNGRQSEQTDRFMHQRSACSCSPLCLPADTVRHFNQEFA
jgi:hypothetical protein